MQAIQKVLHSLNMRVVNAMVQEIVIMKESETMIIKTKNIIWLHSCETKYNLVSQECTQQNS
jgi:hypothetical protein